MYVKEFTGNILLEVERKVNNYLAEHKIKRQEIEIQTSLSVEWWRITLIIDRDKPK